MEKDDLVRELERVTADLHYRYQQRGANERFSVTVWSALVIALLTQKANLGEFDRFVILLMPIFLFWSIAMLQNMLIVRRQRLIRNIERLLAKGKFDGIQAEEFFFNLIDSEMLIREKIGDLLTAVKRELGHALYALQVILSLIVVFASR